MISHYTEVPCVVILSALPVEYQAVRDHITNLQEEIHPEGTVYERGMFVSPTHVWEVGLVETRGGIARTAFEAGRAIDYFKPTLVFFVGVAGGLKDVALGDVVAATKVYGYESGKAGRTFSTRPEVGNSTYRLVQRAQAEVRCTDWLQRIKRGSMDTGIQPKAYVGPIAAGEKVLSSTRSAVWTFLKQHYEDTLAVEMEGSGFLQAAYGNQHVEALIVRGISDLIDGKADADNHGFQEVAARNASAFAFEVLAKLISSYFPPSPKDAKSSKIKENPEQTTPGYSKYHTQITGSIRHFIQGDNSHITIDEKDTQKEE